MPMYEVEFNYMVPEWAAVTLSADNIDQAEQDAPGYIYDIYGTDITNVEIDSVKEIKEVVN